MTVFTSRTGVTRDLELDIDRICEYEEDHQEWSLFKVFDKIAECPRFTDLNLVATFVGYPDFKTFVEDGFSMEDLANVVQRSKLLGFTDTDQEPERECLPPAETDSATY